MSTVIGRGAVCACAFVGLVAATGCGARVSLAGDGTGSGTTGAGGGACEPGEPALLPEVEVAAPTTGVFVDGFLHLAAHLDGEERYLVIAIHGGAGYVVATPDDLLGPANLADAGAGRHARLRVSEGGAWVDVVDTSDPASPLLVRSAPVDGSVPPALRGVFTAVGDRLLACVRAQPGADASLVAFALTGDSPPETRAEGYSQPCRESTPETTGVALGATWIAWRSGGYLDIYGVAATPIEHVADYNYSPDGVHAYGSVVAAATDGSHIAFDIEHESRFFLYALGSGAATITHAWFGVAGPKKLLGVVDGAAYVATPEGVRLVDVSTIPTQPPVDDWPPPVLDDRADIAFGEGLATLIAADGERLVIADAAGRAYLVPLHPSGAIAPMKFYRGAPPVPSDGCE